jgi:hypothetical protein
MIMNHDITFQAFISDILPVIFEKQVSKAVIFGKYPVKTGNRKNTVVFRKLYADPKFPKKMHVTVPSYLTEIKYPPKKVEHRRKI